MQQVYLDAYWVGYARKAMNNLQDITQHKDYQTIKYRLNVICFYDDYGSEATRRAFNVSRATVFNWKKRLSAGNGQLGALAPYTRRPKAYRTGQDLAWHRQQILKLRTAHPGLGKDKLKPMLDTASRFNGQPQLSVSTIGRLVTKLQVKGQLPSRRQLSYMARTGRLVKPHSPIPKFKKLRRAGFRPQTPGDLVQVDCVIKVIDGLRRYVISAIDYHSEFAFSYGYKSLSSTMSQDFLVKLKQVAPFEIKRIQTDNGSEFYKHFHRATEQLNLIHFFNYPRSPKMNAKIERFNRTVQEEFVDWHLDDMALDLDGFNLKLMDYLIWYNTERPHHTLKQKSPMQYLLDYLQLPRRESNMLWTDTLTLQIEYLRLF